VVGVIVAIIMIPTVLVLAYKVFPKTKFGKGIILARPQRQQGDAVPDSGRLKELLGSRGVVLTPLRPVGMCDFSGQRVECVAERGYVDKGKEITVIGVESTQVKVREVEES
jgi:membrane-bound serine protease (ClpP class)